MGSLLLPLQPHLAETSCLPAEINDKVLLHQGKMSWEPKVITSWVLLKCLSEAPKQNTVGYTLRDIGDIESLDGLFMHRSFLHPEMSYLKIMSRLVEKEKASLVLGGCVGKPSMPPQH